MNRPSRLPALTPGQAQYVLNRMAQERKLDSADVARYMGEMKDEISSLEARLGMLRGALSEAAAVITAPVVAAAAVVRRRRRRARPAAAAARPKAAAAARPAKRAARPIRKEVKASQQLQGIYLSLIKQLPKEKRPAVQKICKDQGRQVAIDRMKAILKK